MKKIILLAALFIASFSAQAQIADGSTAPDFTATDINGVTHNLYDLLDEGKTVILDVSATWCGPCWSYHNSGTLDHIYECYGEEGTDNIVVFMIEGDPSTTQADLEGTGSSTLGDWITGTPYPIIDDANIANAYQITYFPTIFRICPGDKTVYELGQQGVAGVKANTLNSTCTPAVRMDDPALSCSPSGGESCVGLESELSVSLFNSGSNMLTSATIEALVDGSVVASVDWTGSLGLYEEEIVELGSFVMTETADVEFMITNTTDEKMDNNDAHANFTAAPLIENFAGMDTFTVEVRTDNYGNETYWAVVDDMGNILVDGGNAGVGFDNIGVGAGSPPSDPGAYANNTTYTEEVILPSDGCYNFILTDYWGDGVCCTYGTGFYNFKDSDGNVILTGGQFGARSDNPFQKSTITSNEEVLQANQFEVYPNPVSSNLTVEFNLTESVKVAFEVMNAVGQVVHREEAGTLMSGEHVLNINMNRFQAGVYFVNLRTENGITTERIIKH